MTILKKLTKTTFHLDRTIYSKFTDNIKEIGLRRDVYLNRVLEYEIERLMTETPNSVKGERLLKSIRDVHRSDWVKVSISLDKDLIDRMNKACAKVRISRDLFLEKFLEFLNVGARNGSCPSPLAKIIDLISNPRVDFNEYVYIDERDQISEYGDITGIDDDSVDTAINNFKMKL